MGSILSRFSKASTDTNDLGLSLWLVPDEQTDIHSLLADAISQGVPTGLPNIGEAPKFAAHITLTSHIPRESVGDNPKKWLDTLELPPICSTKVEFLEVDTGTTFFKKLFIRCYSSKSLMDLAERCRGLAAEQNRKTLYDPHISLLYTGEEISQDAKKVVKELLIDSGVSMSREDGENSRSSAPGMTGWTGGTVQLVPTDKAIEHWHPIATRR